MRSTATDGQDRIIAAAPAVDSDEAWPEMKIVVYTQGWNRDHAVEGDEIPTSQLHSRVFIDGREITLASGVTVKAKGADFLQADIHVYPSSVEFVPCNKDEWKALGK